MSEKEFRGMDDLGRIAIPKEFRKQLNWQDGERFEMTIADDNKSVIIKQASREDYLEH